jgi:hypothetical protein
LQQFARKFALCIPDPAAAEVVVHADKNRAAIHKVTPPASSSLLLPCPISPLFFSSSRSVQNAEGIQERRERMMENHAKIVVSHRPCVVFLC